jgi:5'-AMP-activated protein kinase catalytic alpha subunit
MEHANSGELFDFIVRNGRVEDVSAVKFFRAILEGVEYLHYNGVCHRDLKPENMLLEKETDQLKIIDFGLSNLYSKPSDLLETACGSPCYAAPEMIAGKAYKGLEVDMWSCGIILYAMLCGYLPFEDPDTDKLYKKIIRCDYTFPHYISAEGKDLIQKILNTNPKERYKLADVRKHPWYVNNSLVLSQRPSEQKGGVENIQVFMKAMQCKEIRVNPEIIIDMV